MNSKNLIIFILLIVATLIFLVAFISMFCADRPEKLNNITEEAEIFSIIKNPPAPSPYKTVVKDGREFLQARGEVGEYGGTFYSSTIGQGPKTFNPWVSMDSTSSTMASLMFDSLLMTDVFTGEVIPSMAESFSVSDDNAEYTINLRKGLKWSDGKPITTKDIAFTWNEIVAKGLGNASIRDNLLVDGELPKIEVIDKYKVIFKPKKPFAPFLRMMGGVQIAPEHKLKKIVEKGERFFNSYWAADADPKSFTTSGKFRLKNYYPGQRVEFIRNTDYYMIDKAGNQLPYLDKYVIFIVGSQDTEIMKFRAKELDILDIPGNNVVTMKEEEEKPNSDFTIYNLGPTSTTHFFVFNQNNRINKKTGKPYLNLIKQSWFQDVNFRKAVDYAIDRKNIVNNVVQGVGAPLYTAESLSSIYLNKKIAVGHPRDLDKSKQILKEAGFVYKGKNLFDKVGNRVEFNMLTNAGNDEREAIGVIIKEDLAAIGIKVNFKPIEFNALVGKLTSSNDWDGVIIGLTGSQLEPHSGRNVWSSNGSLHMFNQRTPDTDKPGSDKLLDYEKKLDELFEKGATKLDFKDRKKIYDQYQQVVYDNLAMIYLYSPLRIIAVRNRLGNINPTTIGGVDYNIEEIYIKDKKD